MGIQRFVLPACADLVCLTSEMCLGRTPFERSQETTRLAARSVRQAGSAAVSCGAWAFWCGRLAGGAGDRAVCCWRRDCAPCLECVHSWASGMSCR